MKRNYQIDTAHVINDQELIRQIAFHEAGHAAAIYLYNKQKKLPPVYFQIIIQTPDRHQDSSLNICSSGRFGAVIEGGRLVHSLPIALIESAGYFSAVELDAYQVAFEADMVNFLVGPLAEAKHVALRDGELFNDHLINPNALHNYGGTSDLNKVYDYLETFIADRSQYEGKMAELFRRAFQFISSSVHWRSIEHLAAYILNNKDNTISCEEAIAVLDESMVLRKSNSMGL